MNRPDNTELALLAVRRAIGLWAGLSVFYLAGYYLLGYPFPTPVDLVAILVVVCLGVGLGVAFSFASPLPRETGLPRVVRTALIAIPALGIGIALQLFIEGVEGDRAYYAMFALAAWLGSTFVTEDETDDEEGADASDFDVLDLGR
jgi:hypothetical protein